MENSAKTYFSTDSGFPFIIRVLWFFLVGWHVALWWILIAWLLNLTIVGMPFGVWMLNRVPLVLTLRTQRGYNVGQVRDGGQVTWAHETQRQAPFLIRLVYFVLIGWWFSLIWSLLAWLLSISIVGLPFGVWMFNRLPGVTTLMRH